MKNIILICLLSIFSIPQSITAGSEDVELRFRESVTNTAHKYYLSVSNVTYNKKAEALQMTSRFFIDDLENVLSQRTDETILLTESGSLEKHKKLISSYFRTKLRVKVDGELTPINYLGAEVENDQLVLYIEIPAMVEPSQIEMRFTALIELFEDQKNMVHLKIKGVRKTLLMNKDKKTDSVKF